MTGGVYLYDHEFNWGSNNRDSVGIHVLGVTVIFEDCSSRGLRLGLGVLVGVVVRCDKSVRRGWMW